MARRSRGRRCGRFSSKEAKRKYEAYKHMHGLAKPKQKRRK